MWYKGLDKNIFITKIYDEVPNLISVRIAKIKILDEGNRVSIGFDMPRYADYPPEKWANFGYNATYVQVDLFGISEIILKSSTNTYLGNIEIQVDQEKYIRINITGSVEASIKAEAGLVQSVEGYCKKISFT